ncbi:MAG: hypothetical protein AAF491_12145, partial [Verrucomicrobiota bacterium]
MRRFWILTMTSSFLLSMDAEEIIYDEGHVPSFELPELLRMENGEPVSTGEGWHQRRKELLELFSRHVYGETPRSAKEVRLVAEVDQIIPDFLGGKATLKEVSLSFPGKEGPVLHLLVIAP